MADTLTLEECADMLARLRAEVWDDRPLLIAIHDNVMTVEAAESFERAKAIPVTDSTAERRARGRTRIVALRRADGRRSDEYAKLSRKRGAYGSRKKKRKAPLDHAYLGGRKRGGISYGAMGMEAAFTDEAYSKNPAKLFDIRHGSLTWGTKRWLTWTSYHMQITTPEGRTKFMPARIDFGTGASATAIEEGVVMETETWIAERMAKAGAPDDWIRETLPAGV